MSDKEVYVISNGGDAVKIGVSNNPKRRTRTLNENAFTLGIEDRFRLKYASGINKDARLVERVAHKLLKEKQKVGEWFNITDEEAVEAINEAIDLVERNMHGSLFNKGVYWSNLSNLQKFPELQAIAHHTAQRRQHDEQRRQAIDRALRNGVSHAEVAIASGLTLRRVQDIAASLGVSRSRGRPRKDAAE